MSPKLGWVVLAATLLFAGIEARHSVVFAQEQQSAARPVKRRVQPEYPELAKRMNLTGKVRVEVVIAADGRVISTVALGGHPVLVQAAEKALREWKFAPTTEMSRQIVQMEFAGTEAR